MAEFAGDSTLLVEAAVLQDYLVDKDTGLPLTNGTVTFYQDNSRTTLKNVYYQSGFPGSYQYMSFPNPMTLSAVGTFIDNNGNDTIPLWYPYDETNQNIIQTYYIVVKNSSNVSQFTRENFPFVGAAIGGFGWNHITTQSVSMITNNGYVTDNAMLVTLTLPAVSSFGDRLQVIGLGAGGWKIAQNSGQTITIGDVTTTSGAAGYISSTQQSDSIYLNCISANTAWSVACGPQGNITVS